MAVTECAMAVAWTQVVRTRDVVQRVVAKAVVLAHLPAGVAPAEELEVKELVRYLA